MPGVTKGGRLLLSIAVSGQVYQHHYHHITSNNAYSWFLKAQLNSVATIAFLGREKEKQAVQQSSHCRLSQEGDAGVENVLECSLYLSSTTNLKSC